MARRAITEERKEKRTREDNSVHTLMAGDGRKVAQKEAKERNVENEKKYVHLG